MDEREHRPSGPDAFTGSAARAARRRAARRRLWRQRLIAAGVAVLVLILILGFAWPGWFMGSGSGSGSGGGSAAGSPPPPATQGTGTPSPHASSSRKPGTSATAGTPKPLRTPTAELPLRLKLYGDSVGGDLAWAMYVRSPDHPAIKYWKFAKPSTGIVRPDYFSWPGYFRDDLAHHSYGAVIFMSGANDGQGMVVDGQARAFGSPAWLKEYHRRVGAAMDLFLKNRVKRVYWVGMPAMGDPEFGAIMADINVVSRAEAEKRAPYVHYVDAWAILAGPSGAYVAAYQQPDGVHLSDTGAFRLADAVYRIIEKDWHIEKGLAASPSPSTSP
jgi:uncharacterized protein